jgi:SAM-dependent methyltransferase
VATDRPHYALGDNPLAGDRLALLADVFGPTSEALIRAHAPTRPEMAVDLGCGPGHTTRMLARALQPARTVGLDASSAFVERAAGPETEADVARHGPLPGSVTYRVHNCTRVPWPVPPAPVAFARYLLAHLPDPAGVVDIWCSALAPGGRLLLDEVEHIDTDVRAFATYLEVSGAMIRHHGAELYVGRVLRDLSPPDGCEIVVSRTATIGPTTTAVARLFAMNLVTWRHDPYVVAEVAGDRIDQLTADLDELVEVVDHPARGRITWTHRQLVLRRR